MPPGSSAGWKVKASQTPFSTIAATLIPPSGALARLSSSHSAVASSVGSPGSPRIATRSNVTGPLQSRAFIPIEGAPGLRGARAFDTAFFGEDLVIRAVGDTLALAPALIVSEGEIETIVDKLARVL